MTTRKQTRIPRKDYKANFLWPNEHSSAEEAGYEFANARTERYRKIWWRILISRLATVGPLKPPTKRKKK